MDNLIDLILLKYNLNVVKINTFQKGYRNRSYLLDLVDGSQVNLIIYKQEIGILAKIKAAHKFSVQLNDAGLNVRHPINKILKLKENYYACLYNYLSGKTIPWESYTMNHLKLLGEELNRVHFIGSQTQIVENFNLESNNLRLIIARMQSYFEREDVEVALISKLKIGLNLNKFLNYSIQIVYKVENYNTKSFLHMDFVRGNILFEDEPKLHISGIIDFEKADYGTPLFDLARTFAFLLVDCKYKSELEIRKYFLKSGYIKNGKLKLDSYKYLNELTTIYLIYDFYKFLQHNPYEFLKTNEHYIRTQNMLISLRLLNKI